MGAFRPIPPMRVGSPRDGTAHLAALRRRIAALERRPAVLEDAAGGNRARGRSRSLGIEARDGALPEDRLAADGLHESAGVTAADAPAAAAFLAALLAHVENLTHWLDPPTPNEGAVQPSPDSTGPVRAAAGGGPQ